MKITHNKVGQNLNLTDAKKSESTDKSKSIASELGKTISAKSVEQDPSLIVSNSDASKVSVSERAQQAKRIKELAMAAPDVDQEKVEKFRKMIDDGKYQVDSKAVANKMVDEYLDNN